MTEKEILLENLEAETSDLEEACCRLAPMEVFSMSKDIEFYFGMRDFLTEEIDDLNPYLIKELIKDERVLDTLFSKHFEPIKAENCKEQYKIILTNFMKAQKNKTKHGEMC